MIDDDAFDGFGALTCQNGGTSLDLRPAARVEATPTRTRTLVR